MAVMSFTIPGTPVGAPRMTQADKWKQRPCVVRYRSWKDAARKAAGELPPTSSITYVSWTAYFEPPASWSNKRRAAAMDERHRSKPDRDNLDKALLDALFPEDQGISDGIIRKRWGVWARLEVEIGYESE